MPKPLKKGKKPAGAAPRTPPKRGRRVPANPVPKSPPSPYAQALMFALGIIVTASILFAAIYGSEQNPEGEVGNWMPAKSAEAPKILPPTEPPPATPAEGEILPLAGQDASGSPVVETPATVGQGLTE